MSPSFQNPHLKNQCISVSHSGILRETLQYYIYMNIIFSLQMYDTSFDEFSNLEDFGLAEGMRESYMSYICHSGRSCHELMPGPPGLMAVTLM
jgi:hypothetical protein